MKTERKFSRGFLPLPSIFFLPSFLSSTLTFLLSSERYKDTAKLDTSFFFTSPEDFHHNLDISKRERKKNADICAAIFSAKIFLFKSKLSEILPSYCPSFIFGVSVAFPLLSTMQQSIHFSPRKCDEKMDASKFPVC